MKCARVQKLLLLYVSEDLPDNLLEAVREHLKSCNRCRQTLQKEKEFQSMLASLSEVECSDKLLHNYWEELLTRISKEKVAKYPLISLKLTRKLLVTNVVVAFIAFVISMWNISNMMKRHEPKPVLSPVEYEFVMGWTNLDFEVPHTMLFRSEQDKFYVLEKFFAEPPETARRVCFLAVTSLNPNLGEIIVHSK